MIADDGELAVDVMPDRDKPHHAIIPSKALKYKVPFVSCSTTSEGRYRGASHLQPLVLGNIILYVQARGSTVRDFGYSLESDAYSGSDLTILSKHLVEGYTIVDWCYAQEPYSIVWMVRDDGALLSLTYISPSTGLRVIKQSERTGITPTMVEGELDGHESDEQLMKIIGAVEARPGMEKALQDPHTMAAVQEDIPLLGKAWDKAQFIYQDSADWFSETGDKMGRAYDKGTHQVALGKLGLRAMYAEAEPALESQIKYHQEQARAEFDTEGFQSFLTASSELVPQIIGGAEGAVEGGLKGSMVMGGAAFLMGQAGPQVVLPEEVVTVPAFAAAGFTAGATAGAMQHSFEQEAGHAYLEYRDIKDAFGRPLDPAVARGAAFFAGSVNALLETAQLKILVNSLPGGDKILQSL